MRLTVVGSAAAWSTVPGRASSSYLVERITGGQEGDRERPGSAAGGPGVERGGASGTNGGPGPAGGSGVEPGGGAILLDMGQGSFSDLAAYRDPATLDAVLITHAHPDHCVDLVPLRLYLRYGCQPPRTSRLFGPPELRARFDGLTGEPDFLCDLPGDPLVPGTFEIAGFEVSVAPVLHKETSFAFRIAPAAAASTPGAGPERGGAPRLGNGPAVGGAPRLGVVAEAGGASRPETQPAASGASRSRAGAATDRVPGRPAGAPGLVYSGDCGRADDLLPLIHPGDTLLVEASHGAGAMIEGPNHLNVAEVVRVATAARVGRLVLTHILDDVDPQAALALARSTFAGEPLLAEPGLQLTF